MLGLLLLVLTAATTLLYFLVVNPCRYWSKRNVQTGKIIPIFGDSLPIIIGQESFVEMITRIYNKVSDVRYLGMYQFQTPLLVLKSPELIKQICVKDFDHFVDHITMIPDDVEELWNNNLMGLKGQRWKHMRSTLSPSFTSSKIKSMFVLICNNANSFAQHFVQKNEEVHEVELKDAYTRYTNDVIASVAFGVHVDSLKDRENEFYMMGREVTKFVATTWKKIIFFLYIIFPRFMALTGIQIFGAKTKSFFMNLVKDTIKMREEQNINRPDMLGLLIEARNEQGKENTTEIKDASFAAVEEHLEMKNITDADIASQVFIFFLGGFETVSTAMCFMAHELATNPDVQKRLIEEIDENRPENGAPSYETVVNMTYLDMVVSETLRKWPVNVETDRVVTKPYTIQPELPGEQPVHLEQNVNLMIPIFAIHRDPKYYEGPEKFDPERFSPENRKNIDPYTYLPFGVGPRNCIGSRFALLEIKAVFFYLLSYFEIVPVESTEIPVRISRTNLNLGSDNGFHLGLKRRN